MLPLWRPSKLRRNKTHQCGIQLYYIEHTYLTFNKQLKWYNYIITSYYLQHFTKHVSV